MKRFLLYCLVVILAASASAQSKSINQRVVIDIPFTLSGAEKSHIRYDLDSVALATSLHNLELLSKDSTAVIKSIEFYSSVSPEGNYRVNAKLGKIRLETAEHIVREYIHWDNSVKVTYKQQFIPWNEYLIPAIQADTTIPHREELLELMLNTKRDKRRQKLMEVRNGELWKIVQERYFDHIRKGGAIITVERKVLDDIITSQPPYGVDALAVEDFAISKIEPIKIVVPVEPEPEPESKDAKYAISIKTNAAAISALILNLGAEVKLSHRWSIDLMGTYSPYNMIVRNRKIRLFGIRPEARFWWGEAMKRGHFIGLHGFTSAFNVQLGNKARYQDPNHALWGVGLAYGYALPLGKKEKWGVEFTLGLGYARIKYNKYEGGANGQFIENKLINYFGPTRLGINFSYRFDIDGKKKK